MKNMARKTATAFAVITFLSQIFIATSLFADSIRCGRKVVRTGDSPAALLERCGEPRYRGKAYARVKTKDGMKEVRVDQWHYKKNARSLERIVMIYRGAVVRVETGGR